MSNRIVKGSATTLYDHGCGNLLLSENTTPLPHLTDEMLDKERCSLQEFTT